MNVEPESQCHDATDACKVTSFSVSSQLSGTLKFSAKTGRQISAFPIIIDFRRLIQLASKSSVHNNIIPGTTNEELLHAVVGLYDVCLSEMTPDVLYSTVCDKWAKTILLIQDLKETVSELKRRKETELEANQETVDGSNTEGSCEQSERDEATTEDDVFVPEDSPVSLFADIYSDTESESEEDSEDEDFSKGIHSFIKAAAERKKQRRKCVSVESRHVGIEDRLVGCLTYEKKYIKGTEKVAHLTLLSVRRRYRKFGVGKFLIKQVLEESVVGPYDAVVVHADNGAVDFFHRCGFSDDVVLNSRWSELAEQFTNCTLMCFLPGFTVPPAPVDGEKESSCLVALEKEMKQWKEKSLEAYQAQLTCYMRMKQEVVQLQHLVHSQSSLLRDLSVQNQHLLRDKKISDHKVKVFGEADLQSTEDAPVFTEDDPETAGVLLELEKRVEILDLMRRYRHSYHSQSSEPGHHMSDGAYVRSQEEPYDHTLDAAMFYKITEEFKHSVGSDQSLTQKYEVNMITKACLSRKAELDLWVCLAGLVEPNNCIQMYYCQQGQTTGTETNPPGERTDRLQAILNEGFSEQEFVCGSGGKGLYFTRYPSRASQFSSEAGVLILAEVAVGKSEVLDTPNPQRDSPGYGYDSILVRGESSGEGPDDKLGEKFVVFNPSQARPVSMISYSAVKDKV